MTAFNGFYKKKGPMLEKDYKYKSGKSGRKLKCKYDAEKALNNLKVTGV